MEVHILPLEVELRQPQASRRIEVELRVADPSDEDDGTLHPVGELLDGPIAEHAALRLVGQHENVVLPVEEAPPELRALVSGAEAVADLEVVSEELVVVEPGLLLGRDRLLLGIGEELARASPWRMRDPGDAGEDEDVQLDPVRAGEVEGVAERPVPHLVHPRAESHRLETGSRHRSTSG
jgi:hypothetical protein